MEIPYVVTPRKDTGLFNSKIAIWLFLASEVMLFGGLFSGYVFLRLGADYPWPERTLPVLPGLLNTFILIFSSVTVVFAWAALKMRKWRQFQIFMGITVACAAIFMVFKGLEYSVKFHHQALRLTDFSVVEGHINYVKDKADGASHDEQAEYVRDHQGRKIEANQHVFAVNQVTLNLARATHQPWLEAWLAEAEQSQTQFTLTQDVDFNAEGESDPELRFQKGAPLTPDLLADIRSEFERNYAANASWRKRYLREAWNLKWADVKENDLLSEAAFAVDYPKAFELDPGEKKKAYTRWKSGQRALFAQDVSVSEVTLGSGEKLPVTIDELTYSEREKPAPTAVSFASGKPVVVRHGSRDVITDYKPSNRTIQLRDGTSLTGEYRPSPMDFHFVDGLDFQHLAMDAEAKSLDPEIAIENSYLLQNHPIVAELWQMHQHAIDQLEAILAEDDREPTEKDRYRMGWQTIAYYMDLLDEHRKYGKEGVPEFKLKPNANSAPKVSMTLKEHFMGPDHEARSFPHLVIPRTEVLLDSKFTPKWNSYYAIYFTITGLHGLHVIGGAMVLAYYLFFGRSMYLSNPEWLANRVEVGGLFWHFVDLVWIFAFPIFYLM